MLLKILLFITSIITSVRTKSVNTTEIKHKEFCIYTINSMIKMVDPYYTDSSNNIVYFDNIEEYARYIGPDWFGVAYCGNSTLVNNIGEYFKVDENANYANRDIEESNVQNEKQDDEDKISIFKSRSIPEYKEKLEKIYKDFRENGLKGIPLASQHNPAYNPYHHTLIEIDGIRPDEINFVTTMGIPYTGSEKLFKELAKDKKSDFIDCPSLSNKGASITCTVSYTDLIQDTISISNENSYSYHRSNGKTITKGDTYTEEQNKSIELAHALSISISTSGSTSKGFSKSFEKTHGIINSTNNSITISTDDTHTINEDHSHAVTEGKDVANEINWSESDETSKSEEYSRMDRKYFEKARGVNFYKAEKVDTNSELANTVNYIKGTDVYKYIEEKVKIGTEQGWDWVVIDVIDDGIKAAGFGDLVNSAYGEDRVYSAYSYA